MKSIVKMIMVNFVTLTVKTGYSDKGPEVRNLVTMSLQKLKLLKLVTKSL